LTALEACRAASASWYACAVLSAVTADHEAIAAWIQSATPQGVYFYTTGDAAVLAGTGGNVMAALQAASYSRVFGIYSTTQIVSGTATAPNNVYAAVAAMGVAMGLNTGLANSNYTMKFKVLTGITAEPLTQTQALAIEALDGNVYVGTANVFVWLEQGTVANGQFFDEVLNLDMLSADLQYSLINMLQSAPSVPQTNAGEAQVIAVASQPCERAVTRGFIAPGTWTGPTVLSLTSGTPLPKGYLLQAQSFTAQSAGDTAARKGMPLYVSFVEAGTMHSLTIGVYVQR
jgi:hypothetical protein